MNGTAGKLAGRTRMGHRWWCSCRHCRPWNDRRLARVVDRRQAKAQIAEQREAS